MTEETEGPVHGASNGELLICQRRPACHARASSLEITFGYRGIIHLRLKVVWDCGRIPFASYFVYVYPYREGAFTQSRAAAIDFSRPQMSGTPAGIQLFFVDFQGPSRDST